METKRQVIIFENSYTLTNYLVKKWTEIIRQSVSQRGRATIALSGGQTPVEFYSKLSNIKDSDLWVNSHVFLADERFVSTQDKDSNFRMISENLLNFVDIPQDNLHPVNCEAKNIEAVADQYTSVLENFLEFRRNELPCFDLILLGLGDDGHTASLFPDDENYAVGNRLILPVSINRLKEERVSLSLPVINNADHCIFMVLGANKADIVQRLIEKNEDCPASQVKPSAGECIYLLDKESASKLNYLENYTLFEEGIILNETDTSE